MPTVAGGVAQVSRKTGPKTFMPPVQTAVIVGLLSCLRRASTVHMCFGKPVGFVCTFPSHLGKAPTRDACRLLFAVSSSIWERRSQDTSGTFCS